MGETDMADEYKCRYHIIDFQVGDAEALEHFQVDIR